MKNHAIEGPVFPIVTPFKEDSEGVYPIDFPTLKRYVDYLIEQGAINIMVASATSRFAQLTELEIRQVNEVVVNQVGTRGISIASTGILGSTALHVETAQHAESVGASVIACEYPWRFQSIKALVAYFQTIVEKTKTIKIMLHVTPGRSELGGLYRYDVEALEEICALPRVVGMKEASGDKEHSRDIWQALSDKSSIIVAGRASQTYYEAYNYGVSGYFAGTGNLDPKSSMEIHQLMKAGKREAAKELIDRYEIPFLNKAKSFGWHASLKAGLVELGLMDDTERPPMAPISLEQRAELAAIMRECGWLA